jgi:hypothetical protein
MISAPVSLRASLPLAPAVSTTVEQLRNLYSRNRLARALLDATAERTLRAWRETALSTACAELHEKLGECPPKKMVIEVFKELHGLGVVRHIVGRSGHQTRIEWVYRSTSVAAVAAGRAAEFENWGQSERSRRRRKERLVKGKKARPVVEAAASSAVTDAMPVPKTAPKSGRSRRANEPRVVLDLGCGVAVTWNRPRNPTPAEAEHFAKAVAATVQSLAGVGA